MNKRIVFVAIFLMAILSLSFIQMDSITAFNEEILHDDYDIVNDSDGNYNDIGYVDVDYSSNNDNNFLGNLFFGDTVDIYFDGGSTSVSSNLDSKINEAASKEILNYVSNNLNNSTMDVETMKEGVRSICKKYGSNDCTVNVDSIIGEDQIPIIVWAQGASMLPTIQDGQYVLINKTQDIHVGDIVSINSKEYGGIMKRVDKIEGNNVYVVSDNKNVYYQEINGELYEYKGLCTWVDISEIEGVAIQY